MNKGIYPYRYWCWEGETHYCCQDDQTTGEQNNEKCLLETCTQWHLRDELREFRVEGRLPEGKEKAEEAFVASEEQYIWDLKNCPADVKHQAYCGGAAFSEELGEFVLTVSNSGAAQYLDIDTRAGTGLEFGSEVTAGFDFACRFRLEAGEQLEFGYGEKVDFTFQLGDGKQTHISTLLVFYETTELDPVSLQEHTLLNYAVVSDLSTLQLTNPTPAFQVLALMDYDEDIVFTLDFLLTPGTYDPHKGLPEKHTKTGGWHGMQRSSQLVIVIVCPIVFVIIVGLLVFCCVSAKRNKAPKKDDAHETPKSNLKSSSAKKELPEVSEHEEQEEHEERQESQPIEKVLKQNTQGNMIGEDEDDDYASRHSASGKKTNLDTVNGSSKFINNQSKEEEDEKVAEDNDGLSSHHIGDVPDFRQGSVVQGASDRTRPKSSYVPQQKKDLKSTTPAKNTLF